MKLILYVQCHRPDDGEMRLCLADDIRSKVIAESMVAREQKRYGHWPAMLDIRRWEIEDE